MGRRRRSRGRAIDGVLLYDKPLGWTANHAVQRVKRLFNAKKVGHTGTLDPLATGVLPLCFGEATKFANVGLNANKTYLVEARLGVQTDTGDSNGEITKELPVPELTDEAFEKVLAQFRGDIKQVPSMYSSLKHNGKPLYKLARKGIEIEREARTITIFENTLLERQESSFKLEVSCSKGTYIRTLIEDIGQSLGCGAHVTALRRTQAGEFSISECIDHEALLHARSNVGVEQHLLPVSAMVGDWNAVKLPAPIAYLVKQGQAVAAPPNSPSYGWVRLHEERTDGEVTFLGIGEIQGDRVAPRRLITLTH